MKHLGKPLLNAHPDLATSEDTSLGTALSCAPINALPTDILLLIFLEVLWLQLEAAAHNDEVVKNALSSSFSSTSKLPPTLLSVQYSPLLISSVCAHWQAVCCSSPTLWSNLHLVLRYLDPPARIVGNGDSQLRVRALQKAGKARTFLARTFLSRSGSASLHLVLDGTVDGRLSADPRGLNTARAFHECAAHMHRWHSVEAVNINDRGLLEPFLNGTAPELEMLKIHIKQVAEDVIGFVAEEDYDWRLWYPERGTFIVRRSMVRELVAGLGARFPALRHFELTICEAKLHAAYDLLQNLAFFFPDGHSVISYQENEEPERTRRKVDARREVMAWLDKQNRHLDALARSIPSLKRLVKVWIKCVKEEDGVGLLEADFKVETTGGFGPVATDCRF